jgi:hypothetical protein
MTLDRVGLGGFCFGPWIYGPLDRMCRIFVFNSAIEMAVIVT